MFYDDTKFSKITLDICAQIVYLITNSFITIKNIQGGYVYEEI